MKKFIVFCIALLMICTGLTQATSSADAAFSKDDAVRERFAVKREKLAEVISKKVAHVENSIKKKLKAQEEQKAKKQKEASKASVEKNEEEQTTQQQQPTEEVQIPVSPENTETPDAVSGASANGRERGQKNREWGEQLGDPNLTPEERQGIIQEKKNYNRNNH